MDFEQERHADPMDRGSDNEMQRREDAIAAARRASKALAAVDIEKAVCGDDCDDDGRIGKGCRHYAECMAHWQKRQAAIKRNGG